MDRALADRYELGDPLGHGRSTVYRATVSELGELRASLNSGNGYGPFSASPADYYEPRGDALQLRGELRRNIVWAEYDLRAGETFNEFDLIVCRNVIAGMTAEERRRVYRLVAESLSRFGLLVLGEREKPDVAPYASWFRAWGNPPGLHQRVR